MEKIYINKELKNFDRKKAFKEVGALIEFEQLQLINIDGVIAAFPVSEKDMQTQDIAMKLNQCAVMATMKPIFSLQKIDGIIINDNSYEKFSEGAKKFFLYHEIGHIKNGDLDKIGIDFYRTAKRLLRVTVEPIELKADEYAVSKVGKDIAISALEEVIARTDLSVFSKLECAKRIAHIKRL